MSKVNVDEIKVGDLVEYQSPHFEHIRALGVVTNIDGEQGLWGYWSDEYPNIEYRVSCIENITGHWKVINFEEENKMDELKVYTGEDTLRALLDGKVLDYDGCCKYTLKDGELKIDGEYSYATMNFITQLKLTEVATPQVGDWVRFKFKGGTYTAKIEKIDDEGYWGEWNQPTSDITTPIYPYEYVTFEILSPEQVSEYKREQAFVKVGRKPNEFKANDIVFVNSLGITAIVISNSNNQEVRLHQINHGAKGYTAKPHQLRPISFVENQVSLD